MKREISLVTPGWDEKEAKYEYMLVADIDRIKSRAEMREAMNELIGLGFRIERINDGDIRAIKHVSSPEEILDPKYDAYRCLARSCED